MASPAIAKRELIRAGIPPKTAEVMSRKNQMRLLKPKPGWADVVPALQRAGFTAEQAHTMLEKLPKLVQSSDLDTRVKRTMTMARVIGLPDPVIHQTLATRPWLLNSTPRRLAKIIRLSSEYSIERSQKDPVWESLPDSRKKRTLFQRWINHFGASVHRAPGQPASSSQQLLDSQIGNDLPHETQPVRVTWRDAPRRWDVLSDTATITEKQTLENAGFTPAQARVLANLDEVRKLGLTKPNVWKIRIEKLARLFGQTPERIRQAIYEDSRVLQADASKLRAKLSIGKALGIHPDTVKQAALRHPHALLTPPGWDRAAVRTLKRLNLELGMDYALWDVERKDAPSHHASAWRGLTDQHRKLLLLDAAFVHAGTQPERAGWDPSKKRNEPELATRVRRWLIGRFAIRPVDTQRTGNKEKQAFYQSQTRNR